MHLLNHETPTLYLHCMGTNDVNMCSFAPVWDRKQLGFKKEFQCTGYSTI